MYTRAFALTALAAVLAVGCAVQQSAEKAVSTAKAAVKPKPALMTGASADMLASTCAGCHGTHGASVGPATPTIAGLEEEYFVEVMNAYKSGDRYSTIMGRIAKGYSDDEIAAIAKHYSQIPFAPQTQTQVDAMARAGHKLHDEYCEKCHEDGGTEPEDIVLAGQWVPYINWTMNDYADGHNKYNEKKMRKAFEKILATHGKKGLRELSHFYGARK